VSRLGLGALDPRPWLRRHWALLAASAVLAYFLWHGLHGERGFGAWLQVNRELEWARSELARLEAERKRLEAPVDALQPDRADPDLVEEELRKLGYIGEREAVILVPAGAAR
jgi:cell division protein FtsB